MNFVLLLGTILLVTSVSTQVEAAPRKQPRSRLNIVRDDGKFSPCKSPAVVSAVSKKRVTKFVFTLLSSCALKVIPLIGDNWGPPEKILSFMPRYKKHGCMLIRMVYAVFSDKTGHLPRRVAENATQVYELGLKMLRVVLNDYSWSSDMCARKKVLRGQKQYCYPKKQLSHVLDLVASCGREIMADTVPEQADVVIHGFMLMINTGISNGLLKYICN